MLHKDAVNPHGASYNEKYSMGRFIVIALLAFIVSVFGTVVPSQAIKYSSGSYGTCSYNSCSIGLSSSGSVALNVTPSGASTLCTVQSDSVTATTNSSTGYTVTMTDDDTGTALSTGGGSTIPTTSGTAASPTALTANKWGYRIDGVAGFGSGPTSSLASGGIPSVKFAGIPASNATPSTVRYTTTTDSGTVSTPVWYGVCVDSTLSSGSYTDNIIYTAVVN